MPWRNGLFAVYSIKLSEGGEKLSQEALELCTVIVQRITVEGEHYGAEVLMSAHDYIWKEKFHSQEIRLETCNLLYNLAYSIIFREKK